jgi:Zn-finger nucleic acid-binding protein
MFNIERTDNDEIIIRKKGLRGRSVSFDQGTLDKLIEWLNYGGQAKFSSYSLQVYREGNSLVLHGLENSELTIKRKDIPALLVALNGIASTEVADELAPEPSTSAAEKITGGEISKLFDERQVAAKEHTLIQTFIPTNVHVYRIAYIQCAGCQAELRLEHRDSYAGQALQCPQCSQIILLED